jgi:hypothetical protein
VWVPAFAGTTAELAKLARRSYKRGLHSLEPGEICMTIMYSQIASSRPMLMLDVILA